MKTSQKKCRLSICAGVMALACLALTPSAEAAYVYYSGQAPAKTASPQPRDGERAAPRGWLVADNAADADAASPNKAAQDSQQDADLEAKRQKMINDCKSNRGVDCEQQVDTELQAEQLDGHRQVINPPAQRRRR